MIVFDLACATEGHRFEGWFASSADFASQQARGLVTCPECGCPEVAKAPMAPAVGKKGNQLAAARPARKQPVVGGKMPPGAAKALEALAKMQAKALEQSRWVGDAFAEQSRAQHYGEAEAETIHGQATLAEAKELHDEGIAVSPLPFPVAPPDETH